MITYQTQTHAHDVLSIISEDDGVYNPYELIQALNQRFGAKKQYCSCSCCDMSSADLVEFLFSKNKIFLNGEQKVQLNRSNLCDH